MAMASAKSTNRAAFYHFIAALPNLSKSSVVPSPSSIFGASNVIDHPSFRGTVCIDHRILQNKTQNARQRLYHDMWCHPSRSLDPEPNMDACI